MTERPEHVAFLMSLSHLAESNTEYKISFTAHQLRALRAYIAELERKVQEHGHR